MRVQTVCKGFRSAANMQNSSANMSAAPATMQIVLQNTSADAATVFVWSASTPQTPQQCMIVLLHVCKRDAVQNGIVGTFSEQTGSSAELQQLFPSLTANDAN